MSRARLFQTIVVSFITSAMLTACVQPGDTTGAPGAGASTPAPALGVATSTVPAAAATVAAADQTPLAPLATEPASAAVATPLPTLLPAPSPTAIPQAIAIESPAVGAPLANPFQLSGRAALTPEDRRLAYLLKDSNGVMIASGMLEVMGEPGQAGVFSTTVGYPAVLPGPARVEVAAVDGAAGVDVQIPPQIVNPQRGIALNLYGVAARATGRIMPPTPNQRTWVDLNGLPEHMRVWFDDEPVPEAFNPRQRQVLVLPVNSYRALFKGDDVALFDNALATLRTTLATRPAALEKELFLLPSSDLSQALRTQMRYLNFNGGSGVRYVTYLTQELEPFVSAKLVYAFQGLTDDGQYLISAFFPVSSTVLTATPQGVTTQERDRFKRSYFDYLAGTVAALEGSPDSFTPSLTALDGLMGSLQIGSDLFAGAPTPMPAAASATGRTTEPLNLRSGPGADYRRVAQLRLGQEVQLLERSGDGQWLHVQTAAGQIGWVSRQYVEAGMDVNLLPVAP